MSRVFPLIVGVTCSLLLCSCSSDYVMATKEGKMLVTEGKPVIDKDTGLIKYTDQQGHTAQINSDDISSIIKK
ncbi:YgdI/YgdR family lipoprotein [Rosenbergiella australiborealis]